MADSTTRRGAATERNPAYQAQRDDLCMMTTTMMMTMTISHSSKMNKAIIAPTLRLCYKWDCQISPNCHCQQIQAVHHQHRLSFRCFLKFRTMCLQLLYHWTAYYHSAIAVWVRLERHRDSKKCDQISRRSRLHSTVNTQTKTDSFQTVKANNAALRMKNNSLSF